MVRDYPSVNDTGRAMNREIFRDKRFKTTVNIPMWADKMAEGEKGLSLLAKAYSESVWANRCIAIRANLLASIPWVIRPIGDDDNDPLEDHPLVALIQSMDEETNWEDSLRAIESDMDIYGVAYIQKVRANSGADILNLRRLNPITMETKKTVNGIEGFIQTLGDSKQKVEFPREDIIYFREYHPTDDLGGLSMTQVALPSIQALTNTEKYLSAFFENSALPSIIMTTEQDMSEADFSRIQRWWNKTFKGVNKSHQIGFMSNGIKPETISYPLTDLALEQVRETCRRDICGVFGVPPSIAGAWESANYATALEERRSIYTETLIPRARYYASQINGYLVEEVDPTVEFAFLFEELEVMQPDKKADAERLTILVNAKIITPVCAALEMGYSEDDVPEEEEPAPIPEQLKPFAEMTPEAPEKPNEPLSDEKPMEDAPSDEGQFKAELRAWKRKALRTYKAEQSASCEFVSEFIPGSLIEAINTQLSAAENTDDINSVFESARMDGISKRRTAKAELSDEIREDTLSRIVVRAPDVTVNVSPTPVTINVEPTPYKNYVTVPEIKMPDTKVVIEKAAERKTTTHKKVKRDPQSRQITDIYEVEE